MRGGISLSDTMNKINHFIDKNQGRVDKVFKHENGTMRDNKVHKEQLKFMTAYEVASSLSTEFKDKLTSLKQCSHLG